MWIFDEKTRRGGNNRKLRGHPISIDNQKIAGPKNVSVYIEPDPAVFVYKIKWGLRWIILDFENGTLDTTGERSSTS